MPTTATQEPPKQSWLNTLFGGNVLGQEGINFTVSFAVADLIILIGGVFVGVTAGVVIARLLTPSK